MRVMQISRIGVSAVALLGIGILSGCATRDTLSPRIMAVEQNIGMAKERGAEVYAPEVLQSAENKLSDARSAVSAGQLVKASKLLDEAMGDAEYAQLKAPTEKGKKEVAALFEEIKNLRDEISRMSAAK